MWVFEAAASLSNFSNRRPLPYIQTKIGKEVLCECSLTLILIWHRNSEASLDSQYTGPTSSSTTSNSGSSPNQTQMLGSDLPGSQAVDTKRGAMEEAMDFSPFQRGKWGGSEGQRSSQIAEPTEEQMTISETAVRRSTGDLSSARDRTSQERRRSLTDSEANRRRRSGQGTISESSSYTRGPKTRRFSMESSRLSSEDETPYVKLSQVKLDCAQMPTFCWLARAQLVITAALLTLNCQLPCNCGIEDRAKAQSKRI